PAQRPGKPSWTIHYKRRGLLRGLVILQSPCPQFPAPQPASSLCRNDVQITMNRLPSSRDKSTAKLSLSPHVFRPLSGSRWEAMTNVCGGPWKKVGEPVKTELDSAFAFMT